MLTGRPPFEASTVGKLISLHLTQPAPDIRAVRSDVPADLAAVVAKCLTKEPQARFQSAAELETALGACACSKDWNADIAAQWWQGANTTVEIAASANTTDVTQTLNPS